ncbi:hypothetical protein SAMN05421688_1506 [Poseidonocella pacifica]|uniref:Uncharacterized protein n=1 Tax=Poseidonocella pacifica TaxID=871651 RepID=A0A1I0WJL7_9RHOB|nr:hypothetical protein [Poseidonocella pacifica]SFA88949.1 hypothetical protein SAMN05421688_1506 [Poseidonocella pacifica]
MPVVGLSHPRAITPISDPLHGRMEFTIFDRDLIDSQVFQRLHFVLQNSINYVSFPSNKNTRFPHSLGTAHLCGQMFKYGLSNSQPETLDAFLNDAADFLKHLVEVLAKAPGGTSLGEANEDSIIRSCLSAHKATISGRSNFLHAPLQEKRSIDRVRLTDTFGEAKFTAEFISDTYWQALRHYALSHDLGHLPMSHAFERAIESASELMRFYGGSSELIDEYDMHHSELRKDFYGIRKNRDRYLEEFSEILKVENSALSTEASLKEVHEIRSIFLYNYFAMEESAPTLGFEEKRLGASSKDIEIYSDIIQRLSLSITLSKTTTKSKREKVHPFSFLNSLRCIVDGCVDCDRLDYSARDLLEAGARFGNFDLERIVKSSVLVSKNYDDKGRVYALGFHHRGTHGIEQFFESRYQGYKYVINHRAAFRSNACMERLIGLLIAYSYIFPDRRISKILTRYGYISFDESTGRISALLPALREFINRIEDNSLRSMLYEVKQACSDLRKTSDPEEASFTRNSTAQPKDMLDEISNLADVILFRDFSKIATLFKDWSILEVLERATNTPLRNQRSKFKSFVDWMTEERDLNTENFQKFVFKESLREFGNPVIVFLGTLSPKGVDIKDSTFFFEEQVWIEDSFGRIQTALNYSSGLRLMKNRAGREERIRVYAISDDMKSKSSDKLEALERYALEYLNERWQSWNQEKEKDHA